MFFYGDLRNPKDAAPDTIRRTIMMYQYRCLDDIIEDVFAWVQSPKIHHTLNSIPEMAYFAAQIDNLHTESLELIKKIGILPNALKSLLLDAERLDSLYDRKLSGMIGILNAISQITDNTALTMAIHETRDTLFPEGALGTTHSYLRQAGYVVISNMRISLAMRDFLRGATFNGHSLLDDYNVWVTTGKSLKALENRWDQLLCTFSDVDISPTDVRNIKIKWRRLAQQIESVVATTPLINDGERRLVLATIRTAKNGQRHSSTKHNMKTQIG